jgi:hypothetical protein
MNRAALKPLLTLAVAAVFAQSATMPAWGEHLLSCGFTNALRIIESVDAVKRQSLARWAKFR